MDISFQETGVVKQKEDIIIRRGIVHILDATLGYPGLFGAGTGSNAGY